MQEEWIRWEPVDGLTGKYSVDFILDGKEGLKIQLYQDGNRARKVGIIFEHYADAYRHTNESFRIKTVHELAQKYDKKFYGRWTFFKVSNSEYLKWLHEQSYDIWGSSSEIHFMIVLEGTVIDIFATEEPCIEIITIGN